MLDEGYNFVDDDDDDDDGDGDDDNVELVESVSHPEEIWGYRFKQGSFKCVSLILCKIPRHAVTNFLLVTSFQ